MSGSSNQLCDGPSLALPPHYQRLPRQYPQLPSYSWVHRGRWPPLSLPLIPATTALMYPFPVFDITGQFTPYPGIGDHCCLIGNVFGTQLDGTPDGNDYSLNPNYPFKPRYQIRITRNTTSSPKAP